MASHVPIDCPATGPSPSGSSQEGPSGASSGFRASSPFEPVAARMVWISSPNPMTRARLSVGLCPTNPLYLTDSRIRRAALPCCNVCWCVAHTILAGTATGGEGMQSQPDHQPERLLIEDGPFMTTREACGELSYSRPDSFLRAWRSAGLPVYRRASGRCVGAVADLEKFLLPDTA